MTKESRPLLLSERAGLAGVGVCRTPARDGFPVSKVEGWKSANGRVRPW